MHGRRIAAWALLVGALVTAVAGGSARAAPEVEIHARTQLLLTSVHRSGGDLEAIGVLRDAVTGVGLGGQRIEVSIGSHLAIGTTGSDGSFTATFVGYDGQIAIIDDIRLAYAGGNLADAATAKQLNVEINKAPVVLTIEATPTDAGFAVTVTAKDPRDSSLVDISVTLSVGPAGDEPTQIAIIPQGSAFSLSRQKAGGPGRIRLRASYAGDGLRAAAEGETILEVTTQSAVLARAHDTTVANEDTVVISGSVVGDAGAPLSEVAVSLLVGDKRLAQAVTSPTGTFRLAAEATLLGVGEHALQVLVEPASAWILASRSTPILITVDEPAPVPLSFTIAAFAATALAAAAFFLLRAKRAPQRKPVAPPVESDGPAPPTVGGLSFDKPRRSSTLRRAVDVGVAGVVRDAVRQRPLAKASLRLRNGDEELWVTADDHGQFIVDKLTAGTWVTKVLLDGYVAERFDFTVPHHGELRGMKVDLVPVREQIFALYRRAAEPHLPEPRLWGVWSPRQIVDHVRQGHPSPALAELTNYVEEVYFSARLYNESELVDTSRRVDRAVSEAARRGRPATAGS